LATADQVHSYAAIRWIPDRPVAECVQIEIGISFAVQPNQQVEIEGGCHAGLVVVGRD
jgi:hypothetical protein